MESSPPGIFFLFYSLFSGSAPAFLSIAAVAVSAQAVFFTSSSFKQDSPGVNI